MSRPVRPKATTANLNESDVGIDVDFKAPMTVDDILDDVGATLDFPNGYDDSVPQHVRLAHKCHLIIQKLEGRGLKSIWKHDAVLDITEFVIEDVKKRNPRRMVFDLTKSIPDQDQRLGKIYNVLSNSLSLYLRISLEGGSFLEAIFCDRYRSKYYNAFTGEVRKRKSNRKKALNFIGTGLAGVIALIIALL